MNTLQHFSAISRFNQTKNTSIVVWDFWDVSTYINQGTGNEWKFAECKGHCNKQQLRKTSLTSLLIYYPFIGHLFEFLARVGCPLAQLRLDLNAFAINSFTRKHLVVACCCGSW